ncbi:MAG TPA: hypothetical protein VJI46_00755 [Candidatus Nanoarchaeia archaeon]|nr:hypothetical protein [Candidatus Nanoarchaeia archaeon]
MDLFAHIIWTSIILYSVDNISLAILFGILPDIIAFGPNFVSAIFTKGFAGLKINSAKEFVDNLPPYVLTLYNVTHSLLIFGIVFGAAWLVSGPPVYMLGWLLHIVFDIPTHSRKIFPVRFLYPLSEYAFPGVSWNTRWLMMANWGSIAALLLINAH